MIEAERIDDYAKATSQEYHSGERLYQPDSRHTNVGNPERWASAIGGGALAAYGITKGGVGGLALALLGGGLILRGSTGHCQLYQALGVNTVKSKTSDQSQTSVHHGDGIRVVKSVTINKAPEEIYRLWSNFENLPRFMNHLESVKMIDEKRSHWVAKAPAGFSVEWDAEIINQKENELIAWRSLEGSTINNAGSVRFEPASNNRGCVVRVVLSYEAPGGVIGSSIAKLFGEEPEQQIEEDLRRFKQLMETGEIATTEGQPFSGKPSARSASTR